MKYLLNLLLFVTLSAGAIEKDDLPLGLAKQYSRDSAYRVVDDILMELSKNHPGFYRYTTKMEYNYYIDSIKHSIHDSVSFMDLYRKIKVLTAKVRCLHTDLKLSPEYAGLLNRNSNLIPIQLYVRGARASITRVFSENSGLLPGDEVLSINGQPVPVIIARLLNSIPSDGFNTSLKYRAVYLQFPLWYRNMVQVTDHFAIKVSRNNREYTFFLKGKAFDELAHDGFLTEPVHEKVLDFTIKDNIGTLTIHSFAKTDIKRSGQHFRKFIDRAFSELRERNIQHLVVDLRDNTGGSDPNAVYFTAKFFDQPFRYGNRTLVTEDIARQIKGIYRIFYKKPILKDNVWLWQDGKVKDLNTFALVENAKKHFSGKVYILINGFCMSSCANVTAILSHNKKAVFIGQETGGGYQGNNSGMLPEEPVSNTGLILTVPLQAYYLAVNPSINVGRGTYPDISIEPTTEDRINGKDVEMIKALQLINRYAGD